MFFYSLVRCNTDMSLRADFLKEMKKQSARGRCLHFENGDRCNKIIAAHSIQRSGQLAQIAEDNHVYRLSADLSVLNRTGGILEPVKVGIGKVSTFAGFCSHHDNALFKPIDQSPLIPEPQQVALYAYRCLCRELFVKENAVQLLSSLRNHPSHSAHSQALFEAQLKGHSIGFSGLQCHKDRYDQALRTGQYNDFGYTIFTSNSLWPFQLSGLLYPDFDFMGRPVQDLGTEAHLDLITFFTAPMSVGWSFGFAWHKSSFRSCEQLVRSLATLTYSDASPADAILRFSISCCENHAFRISWWDGLPSAAKSEITERMSLMASPYEPVPPSYLTSGCEGIADWSFEHVFTNA